MKNIFFTLAFLISAVAFSQSKLEIELREKFWSTTAEDILAIPIPEKWKNESAVILKDHRYVQYTNRGKKVSSINNKHELIKILDQSSLEKFSEIELDKDSEISYLWSTLSSEENTIGIRIIKPNADVVLVDVEKEEVTEDEKSKIAIPNLEIGDILDVFIQTESEKIEFGGLNVFPAVETPLKDYYPIIDYRIAVEVEKDFFLNMNTYNGAPQVNEVPSESRRTRKYVVEAKNLEKLETKRWFFPLLEEPSIKFQIAFARDNKNENNAKIFIGEDGERKSNVTKEDIFEYYDRTFNKVNTGTAKELINYLKDSELKTKTDLLQSAIEYIRFYKYTSYLETAFAYNTNILDKSFIPRAKCYPYYIGMFKEDIQVLNQLRSMCKKFDIDYDLILVQPRYDGDLDDLLIKDNARIGLKFDTEPSLYFFDFNENMTLERFPYVFEGSEAYVGSVRKGKEIEELNRSFLAVSVAEENTYKEDIRLSLTDDKKGFKVARALTASGHFEDDYIFDWIHFTDFLKEDYEVYSDRGHFYNCGSKKQIEKLSTQYTAFEEKKFEEFVKKREEETDAAWEDAKVSDYTTQVIETGRYGEKTPLQIQENFILKDGYIKKAGKNIIIEIGKFIGGQVEIEEKERDRKANAYLNYAKTYQYEISLEIPDGYTVKGIDELNKSVENETGSFISEAYMEGNILIVKTTKTYKSNFVDNDDWGIMSLWLDAALVFYNAKILLES